MCGDAAGVPVVAGSSAGNVTLHPEGARQAEPAPSVRALVGARERGSMRGRRFLGGEAVSRRRIGKLDAMLCL